MRVAYISPSSLPSRSANAVHVALQCDALVRGGSAVTLYAKRTVPDASDLALAMSDAYGIDISSMRVVSHFSRGSRADTLKTAALALGDLAAHAKPDAIISRNLYAAFVLAVVAHRPLIFETHQLEIGIRKPLQRAIMTRPWVTTVAISQLLVECLREHHGVQPSHSLVLHDAAPEGMRAIPSANRRAQLRAVVPQAEGAWDAVCGYFGHLYRGRGIEIIESMAASRPRCLFLIFGGDDSDVIAYRSRNSRPNLCYMGHVPHPFARRVMSVVDILLMPYQAKVAIAGSGHDTARWMSPMKMFEYLAVGVPVISSDLPVLREVLRDGENCLLVSPAELAQWIAALDRLVTDRTLAESLGACAHAEYKMRGGWSYRASRLMDAARVG